MTPPDKIKARVQGVLEAWLETREGRIAVLHAMARKKLSVEEVRDMRLQCPWLAKEVHEVLTMWDNPCVYCGSHELQPDSIGSGYCSQKCMREAPQSPTSREQRLASLSRLDQAAAEQEGEELSVEDLQRLWDSAPDVGRLFK